MGTKIDVFVEDNKTIVDFVDKKHCYVLQFNSFEDANEFAEEFDATVKDFEANGREGRKKKTFMDENKCEVSVNFDLGSTTEWQSTFTLSSKAETTRFYDDMTQAIFGDTAL